MNHLPYSFGITIRRLREEQGWSQECLAERADLNRSYVGEIERGKVIASLVTLEKLALALGLSLSSLFAHCEQVRLEQTVQGINLMAIAC